MILIGHPYVDFQPFEKIEKQEDISHTPPHSVVYFTFTKEHVGLCHYAYAQSVSFALFVKEAKEVILAAALGASYIVCDKSLVKQAQLFADDYLFDAKILLLSDNEEDIVYAAKEGIDGILFQEGVKNGSS